MLMYYFYKKLLILNKINFNKGLFRLSFLISLAVFIWASLEAPKNLPIAFGFSDEDHKEIIEKYGLHSEKFKENPNNFISWYFGSSSGGLIRQLGRASWGDRKGKPCGNTSCEIVNKAIDRIIDNECVGGWVDYSFGWLVKNKEYRVIPKHSSLIFEKDHNTSIFYPSEDGYSIIPGTKGMLKYAAVFGLIFAMLSFIFFAFVVPVLLSVVNFFITIIKKYICLVFKSFNTES
jgi:hypothetical protein